MEDAENQPKPAAYQLGQDLSDMSVGELTETVEILKSEIKRLEEAASAKSDHISAAEALFKS